MISNLYQIVLQQIFHELEGVLRIRFKKKRVVDKADAEIS